MKQSFKTTQLVEYLVIVIHSIARARIIGMWMSLLKNIPQQILNWFLLFPLLKIAK